MCVRSIRRKSKKSRRVGVQRGDGGDQGGDRGDGGGGGVSE